MGATCESVMPFGKHRDKPLTAVPADYLRWVLRECELSSGLRLAVAEELGRRGIEAPPPPASNPVPTCDRCGDAGYICGWMEDSLGRKRIRASCRRCHRFLTFAPMVPPFTDEANRNASLTPILDALTRLEDFGVELASDGRKAWVPPAAYRRVPPELHSLIRQCSHQLGRMIGDTQGRGA